MRLYITYYGAHCIYCDAQPCCSIVGGKFDSRPLSVDTEKPSIVDDNAWSAIFLA